MTVSTTQLNIIKLRIIAATSDIDSTATQMIENLSKDFELIERSKVYPSRGNAGEARIYLTFRQKDIIDSGAQPRPGDLVKGS